MTLEQRFTRILELLPDGGSITLTRADLHSLLAVAAEANASGSPILRSDWLTPKQVAKAIGRSPSRVRDLRAKHFPNAEWNGKEFMTPPSDVEAYLKWRGSAYTPPKSKKPECGTVPSSPSTTILGAGAPPVSPKSTDLSGWKKKASAAGT